MGTDKAMVEIAGRPLLAWVEEALRAVCDSVMISGRADGLADPPGLHGPLAGVAAALRLGQPILAVAVDQPWVRRETLAALAALGGTAVPLDGGIRQVTCARYSPELAGPALVASSIQALLDREPYQAVSAEEWRTWGEDGRSWYSVDDPQALEDGLRRFGRPDPRC
jgi:molybdopterin-guanine dinucleotide biosynthesis protein A